MFDMAERFTHLDIVDFDHRGEFVTAEAYDAVLARLSAAEQQRDKALMEAHYVPDDWRYAGQLHAAQDRAEALAAGFKAFDDSDGAMPSDDQWKSIVAARAAMREP